MKNPRNREYCYQPITRSLEFSFRHPGLHLKGLFPTTRAGAEVVALEPSRCPAFLNQKTLENRLSPILTKTLRMGHWSRI